MSQLFTTPFDRDSTASEVIGGVDLSGKRVVVTGANSGIGVETARALAAGRAEVTLAVRGVPRTEHAEAREVSCPPTRVECDDISPVTRGSRV